MKLLIGPMTAGVYVGFYAKTGRWPDILMEQLRGVLVPEELQKRGDAARKEELEKQTVRDTRPSGLLEEEEAELSKLEGARVTSYDLRWEKRWEPNVEGLCPHCGNRHPTGEMRCGTAGNA